MYGRIRSLTLVAVATAAALASALAGCQSGGSLADDGPLSGGDDPHDPIPRGAVYTPYGGPQTSGLQVFTNHGSTTVILDRVVLLRPRNQRLLGSYAVPTGTFSWEPAGLAAQGFPIAIGVETPPARSWLTAGGRTDVQHAARRGADHQGSLDLPGHAARRPAGARLSVAPAASAQVRASGMAVATGTVTSASGAAMPGETFGLYAWPTDSVLQALKVGQLVPTTLLATATTNGAGQYMLRVPAATLKAAAVSSGYANLEISSAGAVSGSSHTRPVRCPRGPQRR